MCNTNVSKSLKLISKINNNEQVKWQVALSETKSLYTTPYTLNKIINWLDESCNHRHREVASIHDAIVKNGESTQHSKQVDHIQQPALEKKQTINVQLLQP